MKVAIFCTIIDKSNKSRFYPLKHVQQLEGFDNWKPIRSDLILMYSFDRPARPFAIYWAYENLWKSLLYPIHR